MWKKMNATDLAPVAKLGNEIHVNYFEDPQVLAERFRLYPEGCYSCQEKGTYLGYAVTHPWIKGNPPPLDTMLGKIPSNPDTYYIHDIALVSEARDKGLATSCIDLIKSHAQGAGFSMIGIVAINGTTGFWSRNGFKVFDDPALSDKLMSYDENAKYMVCYI